MHGDRLRRIIDTQRDVVAADLDLEAVMTTICERTQELTNADGSTILLLEGENFVHAAATGFMGEHVGKTVPVDGTFSGWAYRERRAALTNDTRTGVSASPLAYERGIRSMLAVPLRHGDDIGILNVASQRTGAFDEQDLETLELLGVVLCSAMSHAAEFEAREELLAEQQRQVERLQEVDRLKDEFIALVSHELRTPLTSIRGFLELLLEEEQADPQQRHFLEIIDRNSVRLLRLVGDLLFVAQLEAGRLSLELDRLALDDVARECAEAAEPTANSKQVELRLDVAGPLEVEGDRSRLGQLVDNLVSNALKFTPAGGSVTLRARTDHGQAVLEVCDTGMGIPAEEQSRLFERFFRTEAARVEAIQGTGLGLTIARAIAEGHGGSIGFESAEGVGTTFRVTLPLACSKPLAA